MLCLRAWSRSVHVALVTRNSRRPLSSTVNHVAEPAQDLNLADRTRIQRNTKKGKPVRKSSSSAISFVVLGNGCAGGPRSVSLYSGGARYLFNCGEGTQKVCQEHGVRMSEVQAMFFTSPTWENMGGLLGYLLTLQASGVHEFRIGGHRSIMELFDMTRSFVGVDAITLKRHDEFEFDENLMKIQYVSIHKNADGNVDSSTNDSRDSHDGISNDAVVSYICKPYQQPAKLDLRRCVQLGIPPGPLFTKLKNKEVITLNDGRVVKPEDVYYFDTCADVLIILECPSEKYVDSLLAAKAFLPYQFQGEAERDRQIGVIVHMTPKEVFESAKYQTFLNRFSADTVHLPLWEENNYELSAEPYRDQCKLNLIHDEIFPLLPRSSGAGVTALTKYHIRPHKGFVDNTTIKVAPQEYIDEAMSLPNFELVLNQLKEKLSKIDVDEMREYPLVVFLGTGGAIPKYDRNVSGILVVTTPDAYLLLDCGESTWGQIVRHFGVERAKEVVRDLHCVYISHMHADHHLGLITIINERAKLGVKTNLRVIGPTELFVWLSKYSDTFDRLNFDFVNSNALLSGNTDELASADVATREDLLSKLGIRRIATCEVNHCPDAYGIRIDASNGFSVVYSGDTRPAVRLVQLGEGCDLLIHEATLESGFEAEAEVKSHSTTAEAIEVGRLMNARFTLLTHFSQRYTKLPNEDDAIFENDRIGFAFDHMQVGPKHIQILPHLCPALKCLFAEQISKMKERTHSTCRAQWVQNTLKRRQEITENASVAESNENESKSFSVL